ncbi:hypothetical protein M434DRAFT_396490 [Hypoxylon sp. CO27-5]|nr:hypothetical protein M434DRAFT_396490 [Hypoxylon sp. CO27-5]
MSLAVAAMPFDANFGEHLLENKNTVMKCERTKNNVIQTRFKGCLKSSRREPRNSF